jgi:hypothetical protein
MSTLHPAVGRAPATSTPRTPGVVLRISLGLLFLWGSGVHVGIVSGDPELYRHVADGAWFPGVRAAWRDIFMAAPAFWGLAVAAGELAIATLLLTGGRRARLGIAGAAAFHVGLMLLGWGFWMWSVPVLALLARFGRDR